MKESKTDPVEGIIDHLMSLAREKCVACIANNARMAIDVEHTCELRHAPIEAAEEGAGDG